MQSSFALRGNIFKSSRDRSCISLGSHYSAYTSTKSSKWPQLSRGLGTLVGTMDERESRITRSSTGNAYGDHRPSSRLPQEHDRPLHLSPYGCKQTINTGSFDFSKKEKEKSRFVVILEGNLWTLRKDNSDLQEQGLVPWTKTKPWQLYLPFSFEKDTPVEKYGDAVYLTTSKGQRGEIWPTM